MSTVGLNIATRALLAHRAMMDVIGNNIANVNTRGYVRRVGHLASTGVQDVRLGSMGTGVELSYIERKRATFLVGRFRSETSSFIELDVRSGYLTRIEGALGEPGEGISASLDAFFASFAKLANAPSESGVKHDVVGNAHQLAAAIRRHSEELVANRTAADDDLAARVGETNAILGEVADLNGRIQAAEIGGREAMDLRDQRDQMIDRLAELTPVRTSEDRDGMVTIYMGGRTLVDRTNVRSLTTRTVIDDGRPVRQVLVENQGGPVDFDGGALGALQELRDDTLPGYLRDLDRFAAGLIEQVNALHQQGPGGLPFFQGSGASDIQVSSAVATDPTNVATSRSGRAGDNDLALEIAALADQRHSSLDERTLGQFYRDHVVAVGADVSASNFGVEARRATLDQVLSQREQIEAVSLDEEMAQLIAAEHAYEAAARLMTTASEMIETLISIG